jgi:hypothetical protein
LLPNLDGTLFDSLSKGKTDNEFARTTIAPHMREDCLDVAVSCEPSYLAVANGDVDIWDLTEEKANVRLHIIPGRAGDEGYRAVAWHPELPLLAAGDSLGEVSCFTAARFRVVYSTTLDTAINALRWSPDGRRLAVACENGELRILSVEIDENAAVLAPPFDTAGVVEQAKEFLEDEAWFDLARAFNLLEMFRLSAEQKDSIDTIRAQAREQAEELYDRIIDRTEGSPLEGFDIVELQSIVDLDRDGELGAKVRRFLTEAGTNRAGLGRIR